MEDLHVRGMGVEMKEGVNRDPLSWGPLTHSHSLPGQTNTQPVAPRNAVTTHGPLPDDASISSLPPPPLELCQRFKVQSSSQIPNSRCDAVTVAMGQREIIKQHWGGLEAVKMAGPLRSRPTENEQINVGASLARALGVNTLKRLGWCSRTACTVLPRACSGAKESWSTADGPVGTRKGGTRLSGPVMTEEVKKVEGRAQTGMCFANGD